MPAINTPINGHGTLGTFTWLLNILAQPQSGTGSATTSGGGATHYQISLDYIRSLLVEVANVANNVTTEVAGKILDARQGKVLQDAITAILDSEGAASGIATLDADGKVTASQIPSLALVDVFTVASEAAMLALDAEQGDMAIRTDESMIYILSAAPASTLGNWVELTVIQTLIESYINDLAGAGRTDETVKENADDIAALEGRMDTAESGITDLETFRAKTYPHAYNIISYGPGIYPYGRKCATYGDVYDTVSRLLIGAYQSQVGADFNSYCTLRFELVLSAATVRGSFVFDFSTGVARVKFTTDDSTVTYFTKGDSTVIDTYLTVYTGAVAGAENYLDLRYNFPGAVAIYDGREAVKRYPLYENLDVSNAVLADPVDGVLGNEGVNITVSGKRVTVDTSGSGNDNRFYVGSLVQNKVYKISVQVISGSIDNLLYFNGSVYDFFPTDGYIYQVGTTSTIADNPYIAAVAGSIYEFTTEVVLSATIGDDAYATSLPNQKSTDYDASQGTEASQPTVDSDGIMTFDGVNDSFVIPSVPITDEFTIAYRPRIASNGRVTIGNIGGNSEEVAFRTADIVYYSISAGLETLLTYTASINDRFIITKDSDGVFSLYINGEEQTITQPSENPTFSSPSVSMGSNVAETGFSATKLKNLYVFNSALTANQVALLDAIMEAE